MPNVNVDVNQSMQAVQDAIAWISGITGLSTTTVIMYGLLYGKRAIKKIVHWLVILAVIAAVAWLWSSGLLAQIADELGMTLPAL